MLSPAFRTACASAGRLLLDAVLPPLCLGCGEIVEAPGALCASCWQGFSFVSPPQCARCGDPFAEHRGEGALCAVCLVRVPKYRRARAALAYDAQSRRLVLPFKHGDRTDIARACGGWMARAGGELLAEADIVAPVPLHWRRLLARRYNQAQLLARAKGLLDSKGAAYEEMDVMMDDKKRTEMRERAKRSTVPQIFINGQHIGGSDDLAALEQAGKLDALLAQPG